MPIEHNYFNQLGVDVIAALYSEFRDENYATIVPDRQRMDFFVPTGRKKGAALLFIHGGGWFKGSKEQWHSVAQYFAALGYVTASAGYRLVPRHRFPAQIEDARLAMQYMKRQSARFGFKPEQIVVIGSSAGGLLASLLATISPNDPLGANELLEEPDTVPYGVVGYCPVTTLFNKRETIEALMGCPLGSEDALYRQASPVCRIKGKEPPFLLLQGDSDTITPLAHVKAFHHTLLEHGAVSELIVFEGVNHGFGYGTATEAQRKSLAAIQAFVEKMTSSCT